MDMKKLIAIKSELSYLKKAFDKEIDKMTMYKFAQVTGCSRSLLTRYMKNERQISVEKMIELLETLYKKQQNSNNQKED